MEEKTKVDLHLLRKGDTCLFKNGEFARVAFVTEDAVWDVPVVQITFDRAIKIETTKTYTSNSGILAKRSVEQCYLVDYFTDGRICVIGEEVNKDYFIIDCLRGEEIDPPSIFTGNRHGCYVPYRKQDLSVVVTKIKPGHMCGFTNHEQAVVKTISPSRLHKGCFDIRFDHMVTGYIDGHRGGERRYEWCYDAEGKFANYRGKANNIMYIWGVPDECGNTETGYENNQDPNVAKNPSVEKTYTDFSGVSENDLFERLEHMYRTGTETPATVLDKAVRLFALAAGNMKNEKATDELIQLCDADNDYDFWFPVKYKDEPWKAIRSMSGICSPYRFKSQESCMKAISKIGREGLNRIFGVK